MTRHVGDALAEMLQGYGIGCVFGLAGGQTLPLYDGILRRQPGLRHLPLRDERNAAYAADGYARLSGRVGVCDATVGPGAIKFTSGLAEALNSSIPLLAIVSDMQSDWVAARYRGGGNQLVDQLAVLAPLSKWTGRLPTPQRLPELVRRAMQMATSGRPGPAVIEIPEDLFKAAFEGATPSVDPAEASVPGARPAPDPAAAQAAVALLQTAQRPVMLVGGGAWLSGAEAEVLALAEQLALPVATSLSGKGILPEGHPLSLGVIGSLGSTGVAEAFVAEADVLLAVGFKFGQNPTHKWTLPLPHQRLIQLDIDPAELNRVQPAEVTLAADARLGLRALLNLADGRRPLEAVVAHVAAHWAEAQARLEQPAQAAQPIRPQHIVAELDRQASANTVLVSDASFACGWAGMYYRVEAQRRAIFPRGVGGLGWALPAAIGAQVARPQAPTVVLAGDGAMTYSLGELATLAQEDLPVKVLVLNNQVMGWIKWEQAVFWEGRFISTDLSPVDFAGAARALGCAGLAVADPAELRDAVAQWLHTPGPAVLDVACASTETPVPRFAASEAGRRSMHASVTPAV